MKKNLVRGIAIERTDVQDDFFLRGHCTDQRRRGDHCRPVAQIAKVSRPSHTTSFTGQGCHVIHIFVMRARGCWAAAALLLHFCSWFCCCCCYACCCCFIQINTVYRLYIEESFNIILCLHLTHQLIILEVS